MQEDLVVGLATPERHLLTHVILEFVEVPVGGADVHGAAGRGSSRVFSERNFLEMAVALRLRDMMLPVAAVGAVTRFGVR